MRNLPPDTAQHEFERRGYKCYLIDSDEWANPTSINTTACIIILQNAQKPSNFIKDLEKFSDVLNYDCNIYIRYVPDYESLEFVLGQIRRLKLPPYRSDIPRELTDKGWFDPLISDFAPLVRIVSAKNDWSSLANTIANNLAGRPPSSTVTITPDFSGECELLLKRAFWDCSKVKLSPKTEGKSGVGAYEAFAYRGTSVIGNASPYRCFVKLGPRVKVAREFDKYRNTAIENVPFHLGPRLRLDRCVLGKTLGLITCDYVVGAETLRDCIRDGRGVHAIGGLFNQTLISWRRNSNPEDRPLQKSLAEFLPSEQAVPEHLEPIIKKYGGTKTLEELKNVIMGANLSGKVLTGTIHGDLHATNVLVRMNDAVIIDLERVKMNQPVLVDAASLEAGLLVDGFVGERRTGEDILSSVKFLYELDALSHDDHYCDPANKSAWFVDSVRQIRMQARQMEQEKHQYAWALAVILLSKSCKFGALQAVKSDDAQDDVHLTDEHIRAITFVVAEKIIDSIKNKHMGA